MTVKQEKIFKTDSVWKAIATMAVPAMVSMVVMILYNMADMFFVGRTGDNAQVASVSLVGPVFTIIMAVGSMLGGGGCALIAKTLGGGDKDAVRLYSSLCCWGGLAFGALLAVFGVLLRNPLLRFLGANDEIWGYAQTYLTVLLLGAPVMIFCSAFGNILRSEGAVKEAMLGNLISTVTNIILDPLFILTLGWGVGGAAIATVLGNAAGGAYFIWYVTTHETALTLSPRYALRQPLAIGRVVSIGLPNATSSLLVGFANAFVNQLLVQYGTVAVAAMAAAGKTTMVISMIQMGLCLGVQPLMAYSYGAHDLPRLRETILKLSALTIVIGGSITLLCLLNGRTVVALFLKDAAALELGRRMISLLVIAGPFLGLFYIGSNFLQASGNAPLATFVSLLRQGIFLIPLLYVMNHFFGVTGNIMAHIVADIAAALVSVLLALRQYRILSRKVAPRCTDASLALSRKKGC